WEKARRKTKYDGSKRASQYLPQEAHYSSRSTGLLFLTLCSTGRHRHFVRSGLVRLEQPIPAHAWRPRLDPASARRQFPIHTVASPGGTPYPARGARNEGIIAQLVSRGLAGIA